MLPQVGYKAGRCYLEVTYVYIHGLLEDAAAPHLLGKTSSGFFLPSSPYSRSFLQLFFLFLPPPKLTSIPPKFRYMGGTEIQQSLFQYYQYWKPLHKKSICVHLQTLHMNPIPEVLKINTIYMLNRIMACKMVSILEEQGYVGLALKDESECF